jgi:hypothetical protein
MSLEELEKQVQHLPARDLTRFAEWFAVYREASVLAGEDNRSDIEIAQQEELLRRQADYLSDPSIATAWDDGFFDRLRQRLADARAQKAASR